MNKDIVYKICTQDELINYLPKYETKKEINSYEIFRKDLKENLTYSDALFNCFEPENSTFVIALSSNIIIGFSHFAIYGYDNRYWSLSSISVHKLFRNQGISKKLIKKTVEFLKDNNINYFKLSGLSEDGLNYGVAQSFYKECNKYNIELHLSYFDQELEGKLIKLNK